MPKARPIKIQTSISIGNRVKSARMLSGHNRKAFAKISHISMATLRAWEEPTTGRYGLTEKGAGRLTKALGECGIYCTKDWLLFGKGSGPRIISRSSENIFEGEQQVTWGEEESILKDIEAFKKNNPDPLVAIVTDGSMLPLYTYGDYVGGNKKYGEDIRNLVGVNCIVETEDKTLIRRISLVNENRYTLTALNQDMNIPNPVIADVNLTAAAEIVWHRWREKIKDIKV